MNNETIYTPLNPSNPEIRVLYLQPGSDLDTTICCSLHIVNLDDEQCPYEALSYEWGDPLCTYSIKVDNQPFKVRENLWLALRHLRFRDRVRILWIDAICINQEDLDERGKQVTQMGRLYKRAARVIAWLGREEQRVGEPGTASSASAAVDLVNLLHRVLLEGTQGDRQDIPETILMGAFPYEIRQRHHGTTTFQQLQASQWYSLLHFCQRSYWSRLWILQELILPSEIVIQCEELQLSWSKLAHLFSMRQLLGTDFGSKVRSETPFKIFEQRREDLLEKNVFDLLLKYKGALCMDVRDKVYGLREIGGQCCRESLPVDYRKKPSEVCQTVFEHYFLWHKNPRFKIRSVTPHPKDYLSEVFRSMQEAFRTLEGNDYSDSHHCDAFFPFELPVAWTGTTICAFGCGFRGKVLWTNRLESAGVILRDRIREELQRQIRIMSKGLASRVFSSSIVPDQLLLTTWMSKAVQRQSNPIKWTLFLTDHGVATEAIGNIQIGDLLYQLDRNTSLVLRINGERLSMVGEVLSNYINPPDRKAPSLASDSLEGRPLILDYPALRAFTLHYVEMVDRFHSQPQFFRHYLSRSPRN